MVVDSRSEHGSSAGAARAPARAIDILPHADFVEQVRAELGQGRDEVYFRQHAAPEMTAKGYWEYFRRNGEVTEPASDVTTAGYRFQLETREYVGAINTDKPDFPRLIIPDEARTLFLAAASGTHLDDGVRAQIIVRFFRSVSRLGNMARYGNPQDLVSKNPQVAELLMRAAIAREAGIGKTEGRNGAYGVEYIVTKGLPNVNRL